MGEKAKLAFCLFKYFPFGGLQRDFLRIAGECCNRGHQVEVYTTAWEGDAPDGLEVTVLRVWGLSNHRRTESFARRLAKRLAAGSYDAVVGFNKMPGLDLYFAGDGCFAARAQKRSRWYRLSGRCRTYLRLERSVFHKDSSTAILLISERDKAFYMDYYGTAEHRFHLLPPGIPRDRLTPPDASEAAEVRRELAIGPHQHLMVTVGSAFHTKGVDRSIRALASLPAELREQSLLLVVGEGEPQPLRRLAGRLGVAGQVRFCGGRHDVPRLLAAADLLLHPARQETAGMVLIEAMAAGLPVLVTDICGYSHHIESAGAGKVLGSPFSQERLNHLVRRMLVSEERPRWRDSGKRYVVSTDVSSLPQKAADVIEQVATCA